MKSPNIPNPWAGLAPYEDPEKSVHKLLFCGRRSCAYDVTQLIDDNFFVTLYGKSGIGKTSLLNAGVFKKLRDEQYVPMSLRLGMAEESLDFQDVIVGALERAIAERGGSIDCVNVVDEQKDKSAEDFLWNYFARHCFWDSRGSSVFPVVVLDQFEEVLRDRRKREKAELLLGQINYLIDEGHALGDCIVDNVEYSYDFNFRFVVSIREDDLFRLEDSIDRCYLPSLKRCRYRLRSLDATAAREVIEEPAQQYNLFRDENERNAVVDAIIDKARNSNTQNIQTNILSLICNRIFVEYLRQDCEYITPDMVKNFMQGNPFEKFYDEATAGFSGEEKAYIEDHLVDSAKRRSSLSEEEFLNKVKNGETLLEGDKKILQRTATSADSSSYRIELIHDSFCEPLHRRKEQRERRRKMLKRVRYAAFAGVLALLTIITLITIVSSNRATAHELAKNNANMVNALVNDGDAGQARRKLVELTDGSSDTDLELEKALRGAAGSLTAILRGHQKGVTDACFHPNNRLIASASDDNTVIIWDAETGENLTRLQHHSRSVTSVAFSPRGDFLVTASADSTLMLWRLDIDCRDYQPATCKAEKYKSWPGLNAAAKSVEFTPDGKFVVVALDKSIRLWNVDTGETGTALIFNDDLTGQADPQRIETMTFVPGTRLLAYATSDGNITIKELRGKSEQVLHGSGSGRAIVKDISFSSDGTWMATASTDNVVSLWHTSSQHAERKPRISIDMHSDGLNSVAFSPTAEQFVTASADKTIRLWGLDGRELMIMQGHSSGITSVTFSPDGERLASASDDGTIRIWDMRTSGGAQRMKEEHTREIESVAYNAAGTRIVSASQDGRIIVWDAASGDVAGSIESAEDQFTYAAFSPDGTSLVSASQDGKIKLWKLADTKLKATIEGTGERVNSAEFDASGNYIVTSSDDGTVAVYDAQSGAALATLTAHSGKVGSAVFSPKDSRLVATASEDSTIVVWDWKAERVVWSCRLASMVYDVTFSADGSQLASASDDNVIRLWDVESGKCITPFESENDYSIESVVFSPDGRYIISGSRDGNVKVWNIEKKEYVCIFKTTSGSPVRSIAVSSTPTGGFHIASATEDIKINIWEFLPLRQLLERTRGLYKK